MFWTSLGPHGTAATEAVTPTLASLMWSARTLISLRPLAVHRPPGASPLITPGLCAACLEREFAPCPLVLRTRQTVSSHIQMANLPSCSPRRVTAAPPLTPLPPHTTPLLPPHTYSNPPAPSRALLISLVAALRRAAPASRSQIWKSQFALRFSV